VHGIHIGIGLSVRESVRCRKRQLLCVCVCVCLCVEQYFPHTSPRLHACALVHIHTYMHASAWQIPLDGATKMEMYLLEQDKLYTILYFNVAALVAEPPMEGDQVLEMEPRGELLVNISFGTVRQRERVSE
jgi:hypothetical protein